MSDQPSTLYLALKWSLAKARLDRAKKDEALARSLISTTLFSDALLGVNRISLNSIEDIKLTKKQTISFDYDEAKFAALYNALPITKRNAIMSSLFFQEWVLSQAGYKALDDDVKTIVDSSGLITIKDAMPTVDIVPKLKEE